MIVLKRFPSIWAWQSTDRRRRRRQNLLQYTFYDSPIEFQSKNKKILDYILHFSLLSLAKKKDFMKAENILISLQ